MSLLASIKGRRGASGFGHASTAEEVSAGHRLDGKTVLITGANAGLGQETARVLAQQGAHIICLARSLEKAQRAAADLPKASAVACELSDPNSVMRSVAEVKTLGRAIDILICNAGVMALPKLQQSMGYELQFFTNHIGHFALVTGLLDVLSADARVIVLSSFGHNLATRGLELGNLSGEKDYSAWRAYGRSKLANLLFAVELARRFEGSGRTSNAVHPGTIRTDLGRHLGAATRGLYALTGALYAKSVAQGAATTCYVATSEAGGRENGKYFVDCNLARTSKDGRDALLARKLWGESERILRETSS